MAQDGCIDEVLALWMPGPRSYTGEDVLELSCHGSPLLVERLLQACVGHGARPARRGEFTRRAVNDDVLHSADLCRSSISRHLGLHLQTHHLSIAYHKRFRSVRLFIMM